MQEEFSFHSISSNFKIAGKYVSCERYGEGHINDTFRLTMNDGGKEVHYILQRINNRLFMDVEKLMHNIELVTDFCRKSVLARGGDPMRECLTLIRTKDGKAYYFDGDNYFRMYVFIENATTYQTVRNPRDFYESAVAFGNFANLLAGFDASQLYEVLPDFHNTGNGRILGEIFIYGLLGCLADMKRGRSIGLAHGQTGDLDAFRLEFKGFGIDGKGGGGLDLFHSLGKVHGYVLPVCGERRTWFPKMVKTLSASQRSVN